MITIARIHGARRRTRRAIRPRRVTSESGCRPCVHAHRELTSRSDTDTTNAAASSSFPSPYHFTSNSVDAEALARRAARFSKPSASTSSQVAQPTGVNGWFGGDDEDEGGSGFSHIPSQVGVKKMKGIGGLGYSGAMPLEVDPVSCRASFETSTALRTERH